MNSLQFLNQTSYSMNINQVSNIEENDHILRIRSIIDNNDGFESPNDTKHRKAVFEEVNKLVIDFISRMSITMGKSKCGPAGGRLVPFGSYQLDVCGKGADLDTLCIAPNFVSRENFFSIFGELLKKKSKVTDFLAIPTAFVPVIKLKYDGIEMDILFARMTSMDVIPDHTDFSDEVLQTMDPYCIRSLNGRRNTDAILNSVKNLDVFRLSLRFIKLWAKSRGIYSNMFGYLGGFACAMLVAKVVQMNPDADVPIIIYRFFFTFSKWVWPQPVCLGDLSFRNSSDKMPIVTPAHPQQNSTHNVTSSSFNVIEKEFNRGLDVFDGTVNQLDVWSRLCEFPNFFKSYNHFCVVSASAESSENFKKWTGLVMSKIRLLIQNLDKVPNVDLAHINDNTFINKKQSEEGKSILQQNWFIGLKYRTSIIGLCIHPQETFRNKVREQANLNGIYADDMQITSKVITTECLPHYLTKEQLHAVFGKVNNHDAPKTNQSKADFRFMTPSEQTFSRNVQNGTGDNPLSDHSPTPKFDPTYVAGTKRKSPMLELHEPGFVLKGSPPNKFRIVKKSQMSSEPPPPGTELETVADERLSSSWTSSREIEPDLPGIGEMEEDFQLNQFSHSFPGTTAPFIYSNIFESGSDHTPSSPILILNGHSKLETNPTNYTSPIPVINSDHSASGFSDKSPAVASSPIPTVWSTTRKTRPPRLRRSSASPPQQSQPIAVVSSSSFRNNQATSTNYDSLFSASTSFHNHNYPPNLRLYNYPNQPLPPTSPAISNLHNPSSFTSNESNESLFFPVVDAHYNPHHQHFHNQFPAVQPLRNNVQIGASFQHLHSHQSVSSSTDNHLTTNV